MNFEWEWPWWDLRCARFSTSGQLQLVALVAAGVQKRDLFADVTSGNKTAVERPGTKKLLKYAGDEGRRCCLAGRAVESVCP
jgi:DNA invertase Pin-like site-specific DNA recombinase